MVAEAAGVCGDVEAQCVCALPEMHGDDQPHECDCGGSWIREPDGMRVVAFPGGYPASIDGMFDALERVFGG